jgi:uncharacterized membrane protein YfbV (UPF0208 family)
LNFPGIFISYAGIAFAGISYFASYQKNSIREMVWPLRKKIKPTEKMKNSAIEFAKFVGKVAVAWIVIRAVLAFLPSVVTDIVDTPVQGVKSLFAKKSA